MSEFKLKVRLPTGFIRPKGVDGAAVLPDGTLKILYEDNSGEFIPAGHWHHASWHYEEEEDAR